MSTIPAKAKEILFAGGAALAVYFVATRFIGGDIAAAAEAIAAPVKRVVNAVNPVNNDNVVSRLANNIVAARGGDPNSSIGSMIFDLFNPPFDPNSPIATRDTPENNANDLVRRDPNIFLLDPFSPQSVTEQLQSAGLIV